MTIVVTFLIIVGLIAVFTMMNSSKVGVSDAGNRALDEGTLKKKREEEEKRLAALAEDYRRINQELSQAQIPPRQQQEDTHTADDIDEAAEEIYERLSEKWEQALSINKRLGMSGDKDEIKSTLLRLLKGAVQLDDDTVHKLLRDRDLSNDVDVEQILRTASLLSYRNSIISALDDEDPDDPDDDNSEDFQDDFTQPERPPSVPSKPISISPLKQTSMPRHMHAGYYQIYSLGPANAFIKKDTPYYNLDKAIDRVEYLKQFYTTPGGTTKFVVCQLTDDGSRGSVMYSSG